MKHAQRLNFVEILVTFSVALEFELKIKFNMTEDTKY